MEAELSIASADPSWDVAICLVVLLWMCIAVLASKDMHLLLGGCASLVSCRSQPELETKGLLLLVILLRGAACDR